MGGLMFLLMVFFILQGVAFLSLYERHLLGGSQQRVGPVKVTFMGLGQPIMDGLKLLSKEQLLVLNSSHLLFFFAPVLSFVLMNLEWLVLFYCYEFMTFEFSVMFFIALIGFMVYAILVSGYISNSKYGILGALRSGSQSVSYEIVFSLYLFSMIFHWGSYSFCSCNYLGMVVFYLPFLILLLGELGRVPFDFSEGESELVSGYNVEFGSLSFVLLFLSENGSLLFFSVLSSVIFFGNSIFMIYLVFSLLVFVRSSYPRFRYDKMMYLFWFKLLPVSFYLLIYSLLVLY